jgi:hypothetical protein
VDDSRQYSHTPMTVPGKSTARGGHPDRPFTPRDMWPTVTPRIDQCVCWGRVTRNSVIIIFCLSSTPCPCT